MNFSVNQARQLYVVKAKKADVASLTTPGDVAIIKDQDNKISLAYMGNGGVIRTDILENISYGKKTPAANMEYVPKVATVTVTTVEKGKDYVAKVIVRQFAGMSDEETYTIAAGARAASNTATDVAAVIGDVLAKTVKKNGAISDLFEVTTAGAAITITEKEQPWVLGVKEQVPVFFDVVLTPVDEDVVPTTTAGVTTYDWGTVAFTNGTAIGNGKKIADLEYFCMGERGDIYRNVGWPNVITTKYMIEDTTKTYDVLDVQYAYQGSCEDIQKSEKTLTIVEEAGGTVIADIITEINNTYGTNIA